MVAMSKAWAGVEAATWWLGCLWHHSWLSAGWLVLVHLVGYHWTARVEAMQMSCLWSFGSSLGAAFLFHLGCGAAGWSTIKGTIVDVIKVWSHMVVHIVVKIRCSNEGGHIAQWSRGLWLFNKASGCHCPQWWIGSAVLGGPFEVGALICATMLLMDHAL